MTATLTTTPHAEAVQIRSADWIDGGMPRQSYVSPWSIATPKDAALVRRQGRLRETFVRTILTELVAYLEPISPE
jgi:mRNA-degrading endonuclease toxin of MazEF toxin-antitoxin module